MAGVVAVFVATPAVAQEQLPRMTLEEALAIARQNNPAYRRALVDRNAASWSVRRQYGTFIPGISASMSWSGRRSTRLTGEDDYGRSVELPQSITYLSSSASQSISARMTVFDGLSNIKQLRASRRDLDAADEGVRLQGVQVDAEVQRRFYDAIRRQRSIDVELDLLAAARDRLDANERLFRVGSTSQVDVLGAQVDVASQEQALAQAEGEAAKARLLVLQQLGILDESLDFELVGALPAPFDPSVLDLDALVGRALEMHPSVIQADARAEAANQRAGAQRGAWFPTIDINGSYGRSLSQQGYSAFGELNPRDYGFNFGVSFSFPIFNGFQRSDQIAQADAAARGAEETLRETRLQVEQQVRAAFVDLDNAYQGLLIRQRSTDLSRRRLDMAREQYRMGAASMPFISLQQIITSAANEERALVNAEYNFAVALVTLEERVGEPVQR
jgi:outer membrane protein